MQIIFLPGDEPFSQYPNHYVVTSRKRDTHHLKNGDDPD